MNIPCRLLVNATIVAIVATVAACALNPSPTPTPLVSQAANDAGLISTGLQAAVAQIQASQTSPSPAFTADLAKINGYLATINTDAAAIAKATAAPSQSTLQEIQTDANAIFTVAAPYVPDGSFILAILNAAVDLGTNLLGTAGASQTGHGGGYTPQQARLILVEAKTP